MGDFERLEVQPDPDPMSVFLSGKAYLIWIEWKFPHVPKVDDVRAALEAVPAEEKSRILARARVIASYAEVIERALGPEG